MAVFYVRDSCVTISFLGSFFYTLILRNLAHKRRPISGCLLLQTMFNLTIKGIKHQQYLFSDEVLSTVLKKKSILRWDMPAAKASFIFSAPSYTSYDSPHKIASITMILCIIQSVLHVTCILRTICAPSFDSAVN